MLSRVQSDCLYTTKQYAQAKQAKKYAQPPQVDMEELMAQHNQHISAHNQVNQQQSRYICICFCFEVSIKRVIAHVHTFLQSF